MKEESVNQKFKIKSLMKAKFIMIIVLGGMVTYGISNISQNSTRMFLSIAAQK